MFTDKTTEHKFYTFLQLLPQSQRGTLTRHDDGVLWSIDVVNIASEVKEAFLELCKSDLSTVPLKPNEELKTADHLIVRDYVFNVNDCVFKNLEHFKEALLGRNIKPKINCPFEEALVFDEFIYQKNLNEAHEELKIFYDRYFNLRETLTLFAQNAHHHEEKQGYMIYIAPSSDKDSASIKLSTQLRSLRKYTSLLDHDIKFRSLENFSYVGLESNKYCVREKAILRNTVVSFISSFEDNSGNKVDEKTAAKATYELLNQYEEFDKKFAGNLQVYLKDISIDKLKSDLTQEQIKQFETMNKSLQEVTNRLMLIPGVGALAAFVRYRGSDSDPVSFDIVFLFMLSLLIIATVVYMAIKNQNRTIDLIEATFGMSKKNVVNLTDSAKDEVETILKKTENLISSTKKTLNIYKRSLYVIPPIFLFCFSCLGAISYIVFYYFIIKTLDKNFTKVI